MTRMGKRTVALVLALLLVTPALASSYADVADDDIHARAVERVSALGLMQGDGSGRFDLDASESRGGMAVILCRLLGVVNDVAANTTRFVDVSAEHWANQAVAKTTEMGITQGYGDGCFGPEDAVTYEQMATVLVRALGKESEAQSLGGYPNGHLAVAREQGLLADVYGEMGVALSRGNMAQMLDNYQSIVESPPEDLTQAGGLSERTGWDEVTSTTTPPTAQTKAEIELRERPKGPFRTASDLYNTSWTYRPATGPFGLDLYADGTYHAYDHIFDEMQWDGEWKYVDGKLYVDEDEFTVTTYEDGSVSFYHAGKNGNEMLSITIY